MEEIIPPVDKELIKAELTPDKKLGDTSRGGNQLYVVTWHDSPNTVREIGRIREVSYRDAGASSGKSVDLDVYDMMENPYRQLIVWDPESESILGGYRFILGQDVRLKENGQPDITASHLFHFSEEFISDYLPHTMELGRSFVAPEYQSSKTGSKSVFTLENLWEGIASVILHHPNIIWLFGKMTIYPSYNEAARTLDLYFLKKHFKDEDRLVRPYKEMELTDNPALLDLILYEKDMMKDYRLLKEAVRKLGTSIPPLVNSYIKTSPTMKTFGSCINDELGDAIETGIMICYDDIYDDKKSRHVESYIDNQIKAMHQKHPDLSKNAEKKLREHIEKRRLKVMQRFQRKMERRHPKDGDDLTIIIS